MPQVQVGDINMYYEFYGEGEPLLLIAGLGDDLTGWTYQVADFSKEYRVLVFDNRGTGRTDAPDMPYSISMMADDTAGLMEALGIDQAHVLGVSMGGYIAQELAIRHPGRTKSLIMATTSIGSYTLETHILYSRARAALDGLSPIVFFQLMLPFIFTDRTFEDPEMVQMALDTIAGQPDRTPAYALSRQFIACVEHSARGRLSRVAVPTLVIAGRNDPFVPFSLSEELAAAIPNARLAVLDGGGHGFNAEISARFNRAVLDFLAQNALRKGQSSP